VKLVLLFPGQGAQYVGMGAELRAACPDAARVFEQASEALGIDLVALCERGPAESLTRTLYAQPAVVATSLAALAAFRATVAQCGLSITPVAVAGHSVGELTAIAASGACDVPTILRLVAERARAMERACAEHDSGMAAVLGLEEAAVRDACAAASAQTGEPVEVANYNAPDQLVIAGTARALSQASEEVQRRGARRVVPLKVAGAFHTSLMRGAAAAFAPHVRMAPLQPPQVPVVLNTSGQEVTSAEALRVELEAQIASPVRWAQSMARCAELGAEVFVELGPGQVLSGLARRVVRGAQTLNVQDTASLAATLDALERLGARWPARGEQHAL